MSDSKEDPRISIATVNAHPDHRDPHKFYSEVGSLFNEIIMIAAFTGGVQAAILSFFRDLFTGEDTNLMMWPDSPDLPGGFHYSRYSLGMLVGLLAVALSLAVGAVAAINTAIASYYALHPKPEKFEGWDEKANQTIMQNRVFLCMLVQFMAFFNSGISLILLTAKLHWPFTIVAGFLGLLAIIVSAYHLHVFFGWTWIKYVRWYHFVSLILCTTALGFDLVTPSKTTWFIFTATGTTIAAHTVFMLHAKAVADHDCSLIDRRPKTIAMAATFFISAVWAGCAISTLVMSLGSTAGWARRNMFIVSFVSVVEAVLLFCIAMKDAFWLIKNRGSSSSGVSHTCSKG